MQKRPLTAVMLLGIFIVFGPRLVEASEIFVGEFSDTGGGTIINDGSSDVVSSNGSSSGSTSLMSELGLTDLALASDLADLHILGTITDADQLAVSANLLVLRIFGTVSSPCLAALNCATLNDVRVGGSLSLNQGFNPANVLFAFNVVGGPLTGMPWGTSPGGLSSPLTVPLGTLLDFQLTSAQIAFILSRMDGYGVGDVRLGLGAMSSGLTATGGFENVGSQFEITSVPEPGLLTLLGMGLLSGFARVRHKRAARH